jgi:hypothetical protein
MNASVGNPNRNFSATGTEQFEIAGEFLLVFNKFRPIVTGETGRSRATERTNNRQPGN